MSVCQIEERRAGRSYPRTCQKCKFGPCQNGHWMGTQPPAPKSAQNAKTRLHITDEMIEASIEAVRREALRDGHDLSTFDNADPETTARFREVIRSMLQAAAGTLSSAQPPEAT